MALSESLRLAEGATAEVFAWGEGRILKLYREGFPPDEAEQEAERARAASASGLGTPVVIEVLTVEGRQGVVYERIEGSTMLQALMEQPERCVELAIILAELHAKMHGCSGSGLPLQRERLKNKIQSVQELSEEIRDSILLALERLPEDNILCHGDFHPSNILLTQSSPVIIDWVDATQGHPLADVTRTHLMIMTGSLPDNLPEPQYHRIESLRQQFSTDYLARYKQLRPFTDAELEAWLPPVAATRLLERHSIQREKEALIKIATGFSSLPPHSSYVASSR